MEKNTILAVVLSTLVLIVSFWIQGRMTERNQPQQPPVQSQSQVMATDTPVQEEETLSAPVIEQTAPQTAPQAVPMSDVQRMADDTGPQSVEYITIETELMTVVFTNAGGDMVSWKLKEHFDKEENVNMILSGDNPAHAFAVAFGGTESPNISSLFYVNQISEHSVEFYRDFIYPYAPAGSDGIFRLTKRYDFKPKEYMFRMTVTFDGGASVPGFNFSGNAYTLTFGPQIGPNFVKLDNRYEYRHYQAYYNGKRRNVKVNEVIDTRPDWASISGKYFAFIAVPNLAQYNVSFSERAEPGIPSASRFSLIRPATEIPKFVDIYHFYLGPKTQEALSVYHSGRNDFGFTNSNITEVASTRGILAPLERFLKWMLLNFYTIVPNYGIAIILLTLFVKIIFFPLTKKGSEATLRMQALAPKINELREKYKDNPQKMNAEMAKFYQTEGYNPLSGCLPMLLQIPIFIAMYNLFNTHFDLRGAEFIAGWIPDLSVPEAIINFPENFSLPILGWTALRGLPFIYVGSQLLYGKVTQTPSQQSNAQMKMMLYVMPLMFFFILYNMPSGLLIYWIFSNILTLVQQVIINKYFMKKPEAAPVQQTKNVIAPPKKKKK